MAIIAFFGVLFALWLWRATRAAHRQRGLRRCAAYAAVAALAVVELWMLALIALLAAVPAEALFPFEVENP